MTVRLARISAEPLDLAAHLQAVEDPRMGAEITFVGRVRDHDPDAASGVVALEYTSHPDAEKALHALAVAAIGDTGAIVAASHRIGRLEVGDAAVIVAVAAAHRGEAYEVSRALIEAIKHSLPIWKRQIEADGSTTWKGLGG
ncbi:molybdenum cofactor biosynthesis protein MoaE [Microbacterium sp. SYP-A9085]|jgi:molybdopterin synthase catalytic subunit|uniref:molybdenum cofactor biosynthesis protein MoaE n=1 Tax=Microbacterium sp. SYP-A9085 TaxID=2664454 RepID=UPI00129B1980|nr:molybdenum cofactor biosynthesis protein MoaE [Microbacterium sp. SYP-A9085]MRH27733.1 molybdenum cofactor biosynthesis protein MoaE [Microbacterium sp. SYP-A9085]